MMTVALANALGRLTRPSASVDLVSRPIFWLHPGIAIYATLQESVTAAKWESPTREINLRGRESGPSQSGVTGSLPGGGLFPRGILGGGVGIFYRNVLGEISDTTYHCDRGRKWRRYAAAGIPVYIIVPLKVPDTTIEVWTGPTGNGSQARYADVVRYSARAGESVPIEIHGTEYGVVSVYDLLARRA